jgi:hypothetical protein
MGKTQGGNIFKAAIGIMVLVSFMGATAPAAQAACTPKGVYTQGIWDWSHAPPYVPMIYIWNGDNQPDPSKMKIWYNNGQYWELVPSPSDSGIQTNKPWSGGKENHGWWGYGISTGWYSKTPSHWNWDDDSRWHVDYCT